MPDAKAAASDGGPNHQRAPIAGNAKRMRAPHGNFSQYYQVRGGNGDRDKTRGRKEHATDPQDPRVQILLRTLHAPSTTSIQRTLDIGCNQGRVGIELAKALCSSHTGIDIDPALVRKAESAARRAGLPTQPDSAEGSSRPQARFFCADWMHPTRSEHMSALVHAALEEEKRMGFDLIMALSITKWIHIHHSDAGLLRFFASIVDALRPNGFFFLEPQPDRSYEQARRELPAHLRSRARRLRLRMDDFDFILQGVFGLRRIELEQADTAIFRPLFLYRKAQDAKGTLDLEEPVAADGIDGQHHHLPFPWVSRDPRLVLRQRAGVPEQTAVEVAPSAPAQPTIANPLMLQPRSLGRKRKS